LWDATPAADVRAAPGDRTYYDFVSVDDDRYVVDAATAR